MLTVRERDMRLITICFILNMYHTSGWENELKQMKAIQIPK